MHAIILTALAVLVAILAFTSIIASRPRGAQLTPLANVGEGFQPKRKTFLADAAITTRYLLVKPGADAAHVALSGAADLPLGNAIDEPGAAEEGVTVNLFGIHDEGTQLIASGAIAANVHVYTDAGGKVQTSPTVAGTYYRVGFSLTAALADGDKIEVIPHAPIKLVVVAAFTSTDGTAAAASASLANLAAEAEKIGDDVRKLGVALATPALVKVLT